MIQAVIERCAGIDVGKKFLVVCVMTGPLHEEPQVECRKFGTVVPELERLREWLVKEECTHAVVESTGSYWKPVFNVLETAIRVVLANAFDVQNRRGHKTDPNDSRWLAHLLRHGMIRPSFIPSRCHPPTSGPHTSKKTADRGRRSRAESFTKGSGRRQHQTG